MASKIKAVAFLASPIAFLELSIGTIDPVLGDLVEKFSLYIRFY